MKKTSTSFNFFKIFNLYFTYKWIRKHYKNIKYLTKTYAPADIYKAYLSNIFNNIKIEKQYLIEIKEFQQFKQNLKLSNDWFSVNIPYWLSLFDKYELRLKNINVLEIGSWEGLSSCFILKMLPNAQLTSVDTWAGADEHQDAESVFNSLLNNIETSFDNNLIQFKDRLTKFKGTSQSFFNANSSRGVFDLIYIDGSHHCDDVMVDAVKGFELLKIGGLMIFDDYFWKHYPKAIDNPAAAINLFLKLKRGSFEVVNVYHQVIVRKVSDRY